jgi:hypothetical protein
MRYIVRGTNGKEYGPIDLPTLIEWVRQGRVSPDTKVRNLDNGMLLMATNMSELTGMFVANQSKQTTAISSGYLYGQSRLDPHAEQWEDYKFVIVMSVLGILFSMIIGWFGLIFCGIGMKRAYDAAREQRPMAGLGFSIALLSSFAVIAISFLMGYWAKHILFPENEPQSKMSTRGIDDK